MMHETGKREGMGLEGGKNKEEGEKTEGGKRRQSASGIECELEQKQKRGEAAGATYWEERDRRQS